MKKMSIREFREQGLLHEVNRLLLHPLGLALEVSVDEAGEESLGGVWDCRDEPEGIYYGEDLLSAEKAERVAQQMFTRRGARKQALGFVVQPVDTEAPTLTTSYVNPAERIR